jgi:hypothetical protein
MKWSFLPPFAGLKRTRSQAGLLAYGTLDPTHHTFPFDVNSGLRLAFVADYSCEGSGGFSPRFPNTCGVPGCKCGLTEALVCFRANVISGITQNRARMIHNPPGSVKTRIWNFASPRYRRNSGRSKLMTRHPPYRSDKLSRLAPPSESIERHSPNRIKSLAAIGGMAPILPGWLTYELPLFGLS